MVDLIDGGQFLSAEEIFSERRTNEPMEMVVRAEVATYFGRLEDAAALLDEVAPRANDLDVAARFSLAKGRLALWREDEAEAEVQLQTAYHFYRFLKDSFGLSQALLGLAKLARRQGRPDDAAAKLAQAEEGLKGRATRKAEFLRGLVVAESAALATDQGDVERAAEAYAEANRLLKGTERGRYYARSLVGLADLKCALGEFQDSLEIYKEALTVFERYDVRQELAESHLRMARALMRLKRLERAERLAEEGRDLQRGVPLGESISLAFLALVALQKGELDEAISRATHAVELADQTNSPKAQTQARIAFGQVKLAEHDFKKAAEALGEAVELASRMTGTAENRRLELEAIIYLAEAYHNVDTRAGRGQLARASEILSTLDDTWLGEEYDRVSAKYEEQIIFTDDNRLVFDGNQLPRWQEAKRTLEGFLLRNALRQTNNSLTRAARKLGVSKVHVHNLKKKHGV
ncbi:MAG TPA: tetratricopeptide repeat protein [Blastocatellia bacterium]|nr:tetratricopeptide repeat protein [Blastocatellia bacterium]